MIPVKPLSKKHSASIQTRIDNKTKPLGALGALEPLALQLALLAKQRAELINTAGVDRQNVKMANEEFASKISLNQPSMLVFAGDHGINEENLSIAPSAVTKQMVLNFLHGGAAINCFCQTSAIALTVVDCGILQPINDNEVPAQTDSQTLKANFIEQRLGAGTNNFSVSAAMTLAQLKQGFDYADKLVAKQIAQGSDILLLGEMGIANTSSASALMSALTSYNVEECVGRGTGITDEQLQQKVVLIKQALLRIDATDFSARPLDNDAVLSILAELGGFEIVQMVAAILAAAAMSVPVVIDGFIVTVAALVAIRLNENVANYLIFSHVSEEKAHKALLEELLSAQNFTQYDGQPLLNLGLRLGEGTGAALAFGLIKSAASFYNDMASFESAGVTV